MAYAIDTYTGNASTTTFNVTFPYISTTDVVVTLDGVTQTITTHYTFATSSTIQFVSAPASAVTIKFIRSSNRTARLVDYQDGSTITENILDQDSNQLFYMAQEALDITDSNIGLSLSTDQWDALSKRITNVANPTANQDAVTKHYLENTWLSTSDKANITTLAGISGLATLAGITSDVTAVAADATDIGAVAAKATEIGRLGTTAAVADLALLGTSAVVTDLDLLATSGNVTAMGLLGNSTTVTNMGLLGVSGVITDLGLLGTSAVVTDLDAVADKVTEIGRLGTADAVADLALLGTSAVVTDLDLLGTSAVVTDMDLLGTSGNVTNMATLGASGVVANIATVAGQITPANNIATLAGISADITAVANISSDIADVQDKLAEIETAADDLNEATSEIDTVANAITNVDLVGNAIANVNLVGGQISPTNNIATVATNIVGVTSFGERYRVGTTNPSSALDEGDLFFNTTDNALKYYNGTGWASITAGIGSMADDTTPQLGGDLDLNGNDIVSTSNADIDIIPHGTGDVNLGADTVQVGDNNADATITTQGTGDLTLNTNNGTNAGNIILEDGVDGDITLTPNGAGEVVIDGLIHPQADGNTGEFLKTDGAGNLDFAAIQGGNITTEGEAFSNYNQITDDRTTTTSATSNMFLAGIITVADTKTWTIAGAGTLTII
jgi:hypothetical protein